MSDKAETSGSSQDRVPDSNITRMVLRSLADRAAAPQKQNVLSDKSNSPIEVLSSSESTKLVLDHSIAQKIVRITAGIDQKQKTFEVNKITLVHYSPFFARVFGDKFGGLIFPDVSAETIGSFVHWLITQELETNEGEKLKLIEYAKFYAAAKFFEVPNLPEKIFALRIKPVSSLSLGELNTFQRFAYGSGDRLLKGVAILKTMSHPVAKDINLLWKGLPEGMCADLGKAYARKSKYLLSRELQPVYVGVRIVRKRPAALVEGDHDDSIAHATKRILVKRILVKKTPVKETPVKNE